MTFEEWYTNHILTLDQYVPPDRFDLAQAAWDARGKVDAEIVRRFSTCDYDIGAKVAELIERGEEDETIKRMIYKPIGGEGQPIKIIDNANMTDAFWLRTFAGQAMQGIIAHNGSNWIPQSTPEALASCAIETAQALLAEIKKVEEEGE